MKYSNLIIDYVGMAIFGCLLLLYMDGLLPQMQMAFLSDNIIIQSVAIKIVLFAGLILMLFLEKQQLLTSEGLVGLAFLLFSMAALIWHVMSGSVSLSRGFYEYESTYALAFAVVMSFSIKGSIRNEQTLMIIVIFAIVASSLGVFQHLLNKPILSVTMRGGDIIVWGWQYYGEVRAFGFNNTAAGFARFVTLALFVLLYSYQKNKALKFIVGSLFIVAIIFTLTRGIYMYFLLAVIFFSLFKHAKKARKALIYYPLFSLLVGCIFIFIVPLLHDMFRFLGSIASDETMQIRYNEWRHWINILLASNTNALLGAGITQYGVTNTDAMIDNQYLAIALQSGIFSLMLFILFFMLMWQYIIRAANESPTAIRVAVASAFAPFTYAFLYENSAKDFYLMALFLILIDASKTNKKY